MKNSSLYHTELEASSIEHKKLYAAEELSFNVTEDILIYMEDNNISKSELADRLNKSKSYISQLLSGSRNMTLRSLSDICFSLNIKPTVSFEDASKVLIEPKSILKKSPSNWQDVTTNCDQSSDILVLRDSIINKSNVIDKTDKDFWEKVA